MSALQSITRLGVGHYRVVDSMSPRTVTVKQTRWSGPGGTVQFWTAQADWDQALLSRKCALRSEAVRFAKDMIEKDRWSKTPDGFPRHR